MKELMDQGCDELFQKMQAFDHPALFVFAPHTTGKGKREGYYFIQGSVTEEDYLEFGKKMEKAFEIFKK